MHHRLWSIVLALACFAAISSPRWVIGWPALRGRPEAGAKSEITFSADRCPSDGYRLTVDRIIDGDTLKGAIRLPWGVALVDATIRLDYDAWEISTRRKTIKVDAAEIEKGKKATVALEELLAEARSTGGQIYVRAPVGAKRGLGRDAYGRVLARLFVVVDEEEIHVAEWMRERGHLRNQ